ncbi:MAG: type I DNA topoisomerase [Peptoniphilus sp. oral taxon 375]|uniref:type I DNA topoisomerase n=1 Tax=Urinicoccus timonensis TaxID=2024205 RepID=UPI000C06876A|nr:type I DNA topoisomerase [Urinicoccus timonensis]MBS4871293.1 type I DNA topoisomerase [Peptoniphilus sp. oral taxon 375]
MKNLVIVESPTKAKAIKKMLGRNYKVLASVGHVRDLPKSTFGIDIENDFEPKYINIRGKGPLIKELKKEAKKVDNVLLATDPDREGEAISWHLAYILDLDLNDDIRVEFNEITEETVKRQIKLPRKIDEDLVDAQQARRILDRIVGYKISPLLWKKVKNGLSAGRVQSVVLKLICEREEEIEQFEPEESWTIEAVLKKSRSKFNSTYIGQLVGDKVEKKTFKTKDQAQKIYDEVNVKKLEVYSLQESKKNRVSFKPFTTSTLQQEGSRRLNFNTKKTMRVAQGLYEGIDIPGEKTVGLITYMRTDSTRISDQARNACRTFIKDNYGANYLGPNFRKTAKKEGIQDAHECIRPTDVTRTPEKIKDALTKDQFKLYELIWNRFVSSQMAPAQIQSITALFNTKDHIFKSTGSRIAFDGFLRVYHYAKSKDAYLPVLKEKDLVDVLSLDCEQHFTQPPARYNEASLIKTLEDLQIGRPSTYASMVSTLLTRYYAVLEQKKITPTELGMTVNDLLSNYFPDLVNVDFTAGMEKSLDEIAEGKIPWKQLVREIYQVLEKDLVKAEKEIEEVEIRDEVTDEKCEKCGRNMVIKMGRYGKFLACPGFPECRNAKPLEEKIGLACPKCKDGEIVVRRSKKGRVFYGCSNYPKCDFVSWHEPTAEKCPKCGDIMTKRVTRKGTRLQCNNRDCSYIKK